MKNLREAITGTHIARIFITIAMVTMTFNLNHTDTLQSDAEIVVAQAMSEGPVAAAALGSVITDR